MFLSKVKIVNFRQFDNFEIVLNKGLNIIVGENNSGKTSLIDAIRYTLDTNSSEWVRLKDTDFRTGQTELSIQLKFDELNDDEAAVFIEHLTHEEIGPNNRKSVIYINFKATLADHIRRGNQYLKTEIRSGENTEGPILERDVRQYLSTTYLKPLRDAENELAAGKASRLSQILSRVAGLGDNPEVVKSLIDILVNANLAIKDIPIVQSKREAVKELLIKTTFQTDSFEPIINIIGSKFFDELTEPERNIMFKGILEKLSLALDDTSKPHGMGYNNLLFMVAELLLLENASEDFPLLLIEEPEAHLHPQLQMKFLKFLRQNRPNLQCILTTHSPNLASKAPLDSLILMQEGKAFPLRKGNTELEDGDYVYLEKFLDVTKSNMFFAKAILIVEGDGENILLPTIAELIGRPLEDYGVSVVNVGGVAYKRFAKIYKSKETESELSIKVACLTDLDLWPNKAEKKDQNPHGFKERKNGNSGYWLSSYDEPALDAKKNRKKEFDSTNIQTFISDEWTFEYCLIKYGLAEEIYNCLGDTSGTNFDSLPTDEEERAIAIYSKIDIKDKKTEVCYKLAEKLREIYSGNASVLITKLPPYIIKAIEYVTEPLVNVAVVDIVSEEK